MGRLVTGHLDKDLLTPTGHELDQRRGDCPTISEVPEAELAGAILGRRVASSASGLSLNLITDQPEPTHTEGHGVIEKPAQAFLMKKFNVGDPTTLKQAWQRHYFIRWHAGD
jgi:hypothetical protein